MEDSWNDLFYYTCIIYFENKIFWLRILIFNFVGKFYLIKNYKTNIKFIHLELQFSLFNPV